MKTIDTPWRDRVLVLRADSVGMTETELAFTEAELATASTFKLASRRQEWLLSRMASKHLAMQLALTDNPRAITIERPFLVIGGTRSDWRASLSHSEPYAGAAMAKTPLGLDVQLVRDLDERSAHLFLSPEETEQLHRCMIPHRILHFWCAKEAAWKKRSDEFVTLRQVPLTLIEERATGLSFDAVETECIDDVIVAVTR